MILPADFFRSVRRDSFSGTVYRVCRRKYEAHICSMQGSFLYEGRYNMKGYFGALYTSLELDTAKHEMGRYYTVPPKDGFTAAEIRLQLTQVVDLTDRMVLHLAGAKIRSLVTDDHTVCQEIGRMAWEAGIEALKVPSAALDGKTNMALLLDNQQPGWTIGLLSAAPY